MKNRQVMVLAAALLAAATAVAVPAHPGFGTVRQPDGTEVKVRLRGDEWCHWHEDAAGYTVVRDSSSKEWVYADLDADGDFTPTALRVGRDAPPPTLAKGLRSRVRQTRAAQMKKTASSDVPRKTATKGTLRNLVVLVQFPDLKFKYAAADFEKLYNQTGYSTGGAYGSVKDYYKEVSYGQLTMESVVAGPVTVSKGYADYGQNAVDDNAVKDMVAEALRLLDAQGFDFSQCDVDGDGEIDGIDIIHAGYGAEYGGNSQDYIWSHQWQLRSAVYYDGVRIFHYHTEAEIDGWESRLSSNKITPIGVICHETGHFLGLPDLYDTDYSSSGVGSFCLMASGSWNGGGMRPAHMSAWCKTRLGWVTPTEITTTGDYSLPRVEDNQTIYKLHGNFTSAKEYFLIENRQGHGFDAALPGTTRGLLIWHIDDAKSNNTDESHYWVDLEEASGTQHLQQSDSVSGDDADYWRSTTKTAFSATSTPNTASYSGGALGISVSNISASGATMTFHASASVEAEIPLGAALDNASLAFTTGGDAAWFGQTDMASDGVSAAQSGVIGDSKSSWLQTTVTGPGVLSFKWRVSSEEACDILRLVIDGANADAISGATGWLTVTTNLTLGAHTIRWTYVKDYSVSDGRDCGWVDRVTWTPSSGADDRAQATAPQNGGTATSSAIVLSKPTVYNRREIPNWITSVMLNVGTSSISLGGGGSFGSTTIGTTGTATYTVTAAANTGAERTWTWNIRSSAGDILHTLVVTQPGAGGEAPDDRPDLTVIPADGWPRGLYTSRTSESCEEADWFAVGEPIYLNSCFVNTGAGAATPPFAVLHEILDESGSVIASWRYDHTETMTAGMCLCWFGAEWSALNDLPAGIYTLRCTVDPNNAVEEEDETNNVAEYAFEVAGTETVTVVFDGNGGLVSSASGAYTVGEVYGTLPTATRDGFTFTGWHTADGEFVTETTVVRADVTPLYAQWGVTEGEGLADVEVYLDCEATTVPYGEGLWLSASVKNVGRGDATEFVYALFARYAGSAQEEEIGRKLLDGLAAGEYDSFSSYIDPGTYRGTVEFFVRAFPGMDDSNPANDTVGPFSVTFLASDADDGTTYGPFGSDDNVVADAVAPTLLVNAAVTVRGAPAARNDCVAAYRADTGELCGLGKVLGDDGRLSMVMNVNAGVRVHFKLWTSASGLEQPEILDGDAASDITMPTPGTFLTGRTLSFAARTTLDIALAAAKWHQVSFNVMPDDPSPAAVFADVADRIGYVTSGSKYWSPDFGGTLSSIAVGAGYWVQTTAPDVTLSVSGTPDPTATITLKAGWNLIGYTPTASAATGKALASALASGIITYVCYGSGIYPGTLATLHPGNGYWVYASRAGSFQYDAVASAAPARAAERASAVSYGPFGTEADITGGDAVAPTILRDAQVLIDGAAAADGDCVAAYRTDDGRLCGLARVDGGDGRFAMVLYLNVGTIVQFKVWRAESGTDEPVILEAADTWVAPSPGGTPLTDVVIAVAGGGDGPDDPDDPGEDEESPALFADPWPEDEAPTPLSAARTYDGFIYQGQPFFDDAEEWGNAPTNFNVIGTICVKMTQGTKKKGVMTSTVSATVKTATGTWTYTGGTITGDDCEVWKWAKKTAKAPPLWVGLGSEGLYGSFNEDSADAWFYMAGARRVAARFAPYVGTWTTTLADGDGTAGHLNFTVNAKGAVSVSGSWPDGKKALGTAQMIAGEDSAWIPWVTKTPTGGTFGFLTRIFRDQAVAVQEGGLDEEDDGVTFESNDGLAQVVSEDGWGVEVPWMSDAGASDGAVALVRAQPPVIERAEFAEETTNYLGVAYAETVAVKASGHPVKFTASKLPTGLSINATTGKISGTPVRAGTFAATIKATSAANAKWSDTIRKTFVIQKLPAWASGTFNGSGTLSDGATEGEYGDSAVFTLSVTTAGKLSGKLQFKGLTYTLAASRFDEFAFGEGSGRFAATAKTGSKSYPAEIVIAAPLEEGGLPEVGGLVAIGSRVVDFGGYRTLWDTADGKTFAKSKLKGKKLTLTGEEFGLASGEKLVFAFDAAGKVKITGTFVTGKKNGKNVTYAASASATVCATELYVDDDGEWSFIGDVYVYFPAKSAKKFGGYFRQISVWCAEGFPIQAY